MELPKYIYNKETNETYECLGMHWTEKNTWIPKYKTIGKGKLF